MATKQPIDLSIHGPDAYVLKKNFLTLRQVIGNLATLLVSQPVVGNIVTFLNTAGALQDSGVSPTVLMPTGSMILYGAATAPTGWLLCDGSAISRTTYATLFGVISTTWGVGNGTTTFNVPDWRGIYPKGAGTTSRAAGQDASGNAYAATLGAYSQDQMQGHLHRLNNAPLSFNSGGGAQLNYSAVNNLGQEYVLSGPTTDGTNGTPRTGHTTEPQNAGVTFIIKT